MKVVLGNLNESKIETNRMEVEEQQEPETARPVLTEGTSTTLAD
jgi:hypothetical protein